ncbi:LamG domain-containing protein [Mycobacterium sp. Y57]|uniref:LamG domain-containing protein n=1 Tax=Mycolicibacterium xanthum TaxID=2796469 RepID=UPI001C844CCF|nr:LamG domain-containing protein [Mycolicibacterium xanthum]MBX7435410.1 LamG domain-containing protein [Mycolicibacterium xanthum]
MGHTVLLLVPVVLLPLVLLLGFTGCLGDDPTAVLTKERDDARAERDKLKDEAEKAKEQQQQATEDEKYENRVGNQAGLVSYWRLGEPAGPNPQATDSAKKTPKHGTYTGAGVNKGVPGVLALGTQSADTSAEFLGTQGYVDVIWDNLRNPPSDFTVELWIRPTGSPAAPQVVYGSYELDAAGNLVRGIALEILPGTPPQIRFRLGSGGTTPTALTASLGDGSQFDGWRFVAATYQFTSRTASLYVDPSGGIPATMQPDPKATPAGDPVTFGYNQGSPTRIGAGFLTTAGLYEAAAFFAGRIDEVALYNVCLDGQTLRVHWDAALSPPQP